MFLFVTCAGTLILLSGPSLSYNIIRAVYNIHIYNYIHTHVNILHTLSCFVSATDRFPVLPGFCPSVCLNHVTNRETRFSKFSCLFVSGRGVASSLLFSEHVKAVNRTRREGRDGKDITDRLNLYTFCSIHVIKTYT